MECCIEKIREWTTRDKLMINDSKTELILIETRQQLCKFSMAQYNHRKNASEEPWLLAGLTS